MSLGWGGVVGGSRVCVCACARAPLCRLSSLPFLRPPNTQTASPLHTKHSFIHPLLLKSPEWLLYTAQGEVEGRGGGNLRPSLSPHHPEDTLALKVCHNNGGRRGSILSSATFFFLNTATLTRGRLTLLRLQIRTCAKICSFVACA